MSSVRSIETPRSDAPVEVSRSDLLAAWSVLENLAVSLDQIGGVFSDVGVDDERRRAMLETLDSYLSVDLVRSIGEARARLGRYVPDEEAELLTESIPYWDYGNPDVDRDGESKNL